MKLNLTSKGILSKNDSKLIDEIYPEVVKKYNDFIIKYANVNNSSPIDLLNPIFSRNPYQSSILDNILKLELLEIKLKQGEPIDVILIDNSELEYPIKQILKRYKVEICLKKVDLIYSQEYLLVFKNLFKSIIYSIVSIKWTLFLLKKQNDY